VHPLFEVDGEREEVQPGSGLGAGGRPEDDGVAVAHGDGAAGQQCDAAGLDGQRSTTELGLEDLWHWVQILSVVQRDQPGEPPRRYRDLAPARSGRGGWMPSGEVRAVR